MTAKEIMTTLFSRSDIENSSDTLRSVPSDMPVTDVLHLILDSPQGKLGVTESGSMIGIITRDSTLEGLGRFITPRDDSSYVTIECNPQDYSASMIAHAVEDADAHLNDLWSAPAENGLIRVTLRVGHNDPSAVVRNLERYGFSVTDTYGADVLRSDAIATERLLSLQSLLNV